MKQKILFPQLSGLMHGGDYNPDQWLDRPDILEQDVRLMKQTGMNSVTLGVFAWSAYEPHEDEFHVRWLLDIMNRLYENGIYTILATPTGARPVWLDERYPEAMRVGKDGRRNRHGFRHNHCLSSLKFQEKAERLIRRLAEAVKDHPGLILWHISNELGGECYCPLCTEKFRNYVRERFHNNIDELNHAWWTSFWSHTYERFDQIDPPFSNGEGSIMGLNLAWREFTSWNIQEYVRFEKRILNEITPNIPVTTNFMELYPTIDYHKLAKDLDVVCWDCYPVYHNDRETVAETAIGTSFDHAVMRGLKLDRPFMLMESTPSLVNWHQYNKLKRPGVHSLSSLQAIACGSDTVQYFQWRKGRGCSEQYHGAVVDHLGSANTRVFKEVEQLGEQLKKLSEVAGSRIEAKAAVLFDWSNRWAIEDMAGLSKEKKQYEYTCETQYRSLQRLGVETDVVSVEEDLSKYALVVAPMLYLLKPGYADHLKQYVQNGGQLIMTYLSGYVNETALNFLGGFPGDGLQELFGLYSEEIDTLYPTDSNEAVFVKDGIVSKIRDYCEILRVKDAEVVASYGKDFYRGTPVVTRKKEGKGTAWYVAARLDCKGMEYIYSLCLKEAGIAVADEAAVGDGIQKSLPEGIEYHRRIAEIETSGDSGSMVQKNAYGFYLNHTEKEQTIRVFASGKDLLSGMKEEKVITLAPYGVAVIKETLYETK